MTTRKEKSRQSQTDGNDIKGAASDSMSGPHYSACAPKGQQADLARALRDMAEKPARPNPIPFETYHGQGGDIPQFVLALRKRLDWAKQEAARLAPSVAAEDALYALTGEGWAREKTSTEQQQGGLK